MNKWPPSPFAIAVRWSWAVFFTITFTRAILLPEQSYGIQTWRWFNFFTHFLGCSRELRRHVTDLSFIWKRCYDALCSATCFSFFFHSLFNKQKQNLEKLDDRIIKWEQSHWAVPLPVSACNVSCNVIVKCIFERCESYVQGRLSTSMRTDQVSTRTISFRN